MKYNYMVEVGRADKNKVIFDGEKLINTNEFSSCNINLLNNDIKLNAVCRSGRIYGLTGNLGGYSSWAREAVKLPQFIDGNVHFKAVGKLLPNVNYLSCSIDKVIFDENENALLLGNTDCVQLTVRVAQNLYVLLDENTICGAIVCPVINESNLN